MFEKNQCNWYSIRVQTGLAPTAVASFSEQLNFYRGIESR